MPLALTSCDRRDDKSIGDGYKSVPPIPWSTLLSRETLQQQLANHALILMEAAVNERLRRAPGVALHPELANAPLIYAPISATALRAIYQEYIDIAAAAGLPLLLCAPTWRAGRERVEGSGVAGSVNRDAVRFMTELRTAQASADSIYIGGLLGPRNDCYQPEQGLSVVQARDYHAWQIEQLVRAGVDYLLAETLPNVNEALGIAQTLAATEVPYLISFVIGRDGRVMDGTRLGDAVRYIDANTCRRPLGYMVNCAYPAFLCPQHQPPELFERLIGIQANASSLDQCELDTAECLHAEPVPVWGKLMRELNSVYGMRLLGGCCGTDGEHLRYLAAPRRYARESLDSV